MAVDYVKCEQQGGLTLVLYRGEDMVLLAFDIDASLRKPEFLGFGIQYRIGNDTALHDVFNFLTFKDLRPKVDALERQAEQARTEDEKKQARKQIAQIKSSRRSPFQMFRWAHVPSRPVNDKITYIVSAMFANGGQPPVAKATVQATIDVGSETHGKFLNIGFTRGFSSSQAYARTFHNDPTVLPGKKQREIDFDTSKFDGDGRPYPWLGFEARKILLDFLDECVADKTVSADVFAYDLANPEIVQRLEGFGDRLRIIIDNSGTHGKPGSEEALAEKRLVKTAGRDHVTRHKFSGLQHNKVIVAKRNRRPFAVLTGSTNFALRGLYIQNNNVLLFRDEDIARLYAEAFDAAFPKATGFKTNKVSADWFPKDIEGAGLYRFCFSPHSKAETSLQPLSQAIKDAESSVLYAIAFRGAQTGPAAEAIDAIDTTKIHVMGVADKPGGGAKKKAKGAGKPKKLPSESRTTVVQLPGRGKVPLSPAALKEKLPPPFQAEWPGGSGVRMHHKFVICDFNGKNPVVFTGSSNLASGGETGNGDNLIEIHDPKVVIAYAVQAVSIFDHYAFRVRMKDAKTTEKAMDLAEPPLRGESAWWETSFEPGHEKARDRELFSAKPFER